MNQDDDLARAVLERALVRAIRGAAVGGVALGALAVAFLVLADGVLDARSLPQVLILGFGQVVGLVIAILAALGLRRSRSDLDYPVRAGIEECARVARQTSTALITLSLGAVLLAAGCLSLLRPFTLTALSVVLSLAIVAQLVIVLITVRARLRRAAQSRWTR